MIINDKLILDIFNLKITITNKDKIKLSRYQELIPMYDIYSQQIYPIKKQNIHHRLIDSDYRFITYEIKDWIENLYNKYKSNKILENKFKNNLQIIKNYDIDTLVQTSYKTLYEYSPKLGLLVSICKRKSFDPFIKHLKPYYTKLELIKLGQNMKIIDDIKIEKLLNQDFHYEICKTVSSNDVSYDEIKTHTDYIIKNDLISYVTFYSFIGSFLYNKVLRDNSNIYTFFYEGTKQLINGIKTSPPLENNYYLYRFIWDDSFIRNLTIGDLYIDKGFVSTTRDPFYSPGINGNFGLTLVKINIPKNVNGLMIENFSLFPKEEEFLLPPNSKLKLISKDNKFKYHHTNKEFEKLITKKYEFEYIETEQITINPTKNKIKEINDFKNYSVMGTNRVMLFKHFISESNLIEIKLNGKKYLLYAMFFDSTETSSYKKLYYNKIKDGLLISIYFNGYPYLNIECGKELVVNFINQYYFYGKNKQELNEELLEIIYEIGRIFYYKSAKIISCYRNFSEFSSNTFAFTYFYNHTIYDYLKNKNKYLQVPFIKNNLGWFKIDQIFNSTDVTELNKILGLNFKTKKEIFIDICENNFILYDKMFELIDFEIKDFYFTFEIYEKLQSQNRLPSGFIDINLDEEDEYGFDFKLIFRQPIRRF